jgi:hypothetical protein
MTNLGYTSNEGAIPEFRIQLTGTQFELYVAHNSKISIQAKEYVDIDYSVYVPKYVECTMLNWDNLTNVNGNNMKLSSYTFPDPINQEFSPLGTGITTGGLVELGVLEVLHFEPFDVLTGHVLKITIRVINNTEEERADLNLTAYFKGFMQSRKECASFKIMGNVDVHAGVAMPSDPFPAVNDTDVGTIYDWQ